MPEDNIIFKFIRRNKSYFALAFFAGVISSLCTVLLSLSLGKFYEIYFNDAGNKSRILHSIGISIENNLTAFFIFYAILLLIKGITEWGFYFFSKVSAERLTLSLRNKLFTSLLFAEPKAFASKAPGKYLLRFSGDLQAIQNFFTKGIILFLKDIFFLLIGCWFLMKTDYRLALVVFLYIPLLPLVNYFFSKAIKNIIISRRNQKSDLLSFVSERFFNIISLKAFRKESIEKKRFKKKSANLYISGVQYHRRYAFIQAVTSLMLYALPLLLLLIVSFQNIVISKAHLMAFILLIFMQVSALKRIGKIQTIWQAGLTSITKISQLLHYPAEIKSIRKEVIEFKSLALSRQVNDHNLIFKNTGKGAINFFTHPDADLLIKKLLGILPDDSEEILLNGRPLKYYSGPELRSIAGIATNHLHLYGSSIYDASVKGRTADKQQLFTNILTALDFYNTKVKSNAITKLNGINFQQKKLILIARAVLTTAPLLVFDNPFEGLDETAQKKCLTYFHSLLPEKTIIILNSISENILEDIVLSEAIKQSAN